MLFVDYHIIERPEGFIDISFLSNSRKKNYSFQFSENKKFSLFERNYWVELSQLFDK